MTLFLRRLKTSVVKYVISATTCISTDSNYSSCTKAVLSLTGGRLFVRRKPVRHFVSLTTSQHHRERNLLTRPPVYSSYPISSNLIMSRRSSETSLAQGRFWPGVNSEIHPTFVKTFFKGLCNFVFNIENTIYRGGKAKTRFSKF